MRRIKAFLCRDATTNGCCYELFRRRPVWDEARAKWITNAPSRRHPETGDLVKTIVGERQVLLDTNVSWLFPDVSLQPGEFEIVEIAG